MPDSNVSPPLKHDLSLLLKILPTIVVFILLFNSPGQSLVPNEVQGQIEYQIGAVGDDASRGNLGVAAEIQTHTYDSFDGIFDYFWVGNNLGDGAFIQFGYGIEPGYFCLSGKSIGGKFTCLGSSEEILVSDGRWQWQYWPNREGDDYYYDIGPAGSAGKNSSWHEYGIVPSPNGSWTFEFDHVPIDTASFPATASSDPAYFVAEKIASSRSIVGDFGPVAFANLTYLTNNGWRPTDSLISTSGCGRTPICQENPYGISTTPLNLTIAGSGVNKPPSGTLLWTSGYTTLTVSAPKVARFYVSFLSERRAYEGDALVTIPRGLYAYVTISSTYTQTSGLLGLIGEHEKFAGWTGDTGSTNLTIRVLMDGNKRVSATWTTQLDEPLLIILVIGVAAVAILIARFRRRMPSSQSLTMVPGLLEPP